MKASLGPRWAVGGVFEMYDFGGGQRGMAGFLANIGEALDAVWRDSDRRGRISMGDDEWKEVVTQQTLQAYGVPTAEDVRRRDQGLRAVVAVQERMERRGKGNKVAEGE